MDSVTADMLLERLRKMKLTPHGEMELQQVFSLLLDASEAQIRCQHASGHRLRDVDDKVTKLESTLDDRIDARVETKLESKFDSLSALIRSCPARHPPKAQWRVGFINSGNILYVIIVILLLIIAALTGTDLSALLGGH